MMDWTRSVSGGAYPWQIAIARSVARELRRLRSQAERPYLRPRRGFDIQSPVGRAYHQWLA